LSWVSVPSMCRCSSALGRPAMKAEVAVDMVRSDFLSRHAGSREGPPNDSSASVEPDLRLTK
jgi:hypothetical protein